jgi:transcriptional regulator with XRE-family HTH domain
MEKDMERTEGMNLRDARTSARLTLQELANMSGVGWGTIQAIEAGRTPGTLTDKIKLADALRRAFKELFPSTHGEVAGMLERGFKRERRSHGAKAAKR